MADVLVRVRAGRECPCLTNLVKGEELVAAQILVPLVHPETEIAHGRLAAIAVGHSGRLQVLLALAAAQLLLRHDRGVDVEMLHEVHVVEVGRNGFDAALMRGLTAARRALYLVCVWRLACLEASSPYLFGVLEARLAKGMEAGQRLGLREQLCTDDTREFSAHSFDGWVCSLLIFVRHGHVSR